MVKKYIAVFLIGVILGGFVYRHRFDLIRITLGGDVYKFQTLKKSPVKNVNEKFDVLRTHAKSILVSRYTAGSPLFFDRSYFDQIGDKRLEGLYLIQIMRHRKTSIEIDMGTPLTVYRLISLSNENDIFNNYIETDIKVKVVGSSSVHTKVIKKDFLKGTIRLHAGGPVSASPILISVKGEDFSEYGFKVNSN